MVKRVIIFGAHGRVGQLLLARLAKLPNEFHAIAVHRKPEQKATFDKLKVESKLLSLEDADVETLTKAVTGIDVIVFTAGAGEDGGLDRTIAVDLDGAVKTMEAAEQANVKQYIMVSGYGADDRASWHHMDIRPYFTTKHYADRELRHTSLNYTILQPAILIDGAGLGKIFDPEKAYDGPTVAGPPTIHRDDVARFIVENMRDTKGTSRRTTVPLVTGTINNDPYVTATIDIDGFYS